MLSHRRKEIKTRVGYAAVRGDATFHTPGREKRKRPERDRAGRRRGGERDTTSGRRGGG